MGDLYRMQTNVSSTDSHSERHLVVHVFVLCRALLLVALNYGCGIVSELFGGEGQEPVEEVWRMRVSDHRPFPGVPALVDSPFTL